MKLQNTNPQGQVDVPLLNRQGHPDDKVDDKGDPLVGEARWGFGCLEPDEVFDCTAAHGKLLLEQIPNYAPADSASKKHRGVVERRNAKREAAARDGLPPEPDEPDADDDDGTV